MKAATAASASAWAAAASEAVEAAITAFVATPLSKRENTHRAKKKEKKKLGHFFFRKIFRDFYLVEAEIFGVEENIQSCLDFQMIT